MAKVLIEFDNVGLKNVASILAMLSGKKTAKAADEEEAEEEEEEEVEEEEEEEEEVEEEETPKKATLETVRAAAQKLIAAGKSAKLKSILKVFGAAKVVDVPKTKYTAFITKCKAVK